MQSHNNPQSGPARPVEQVGPPGKGRQRTASLPPAVLQEPPSPVLLLRCLRRRLTLAISLGFLLACPAALGVWFFAPPPKHLVRTLIKVPPARAWIPIRNFDQGTDLAGHQRNQTAMGRSRLVLNGALRDSAVANLSVIRNQVDAVAWLEKEVQLDFSYAPEVLKISMTGYDTDELVPLINGIRTAYLREVVEKDRTHRIERKNHVQDLMRKYEEQVKEARSLQKEWEEKAGGRDVGIRARIFAFLQQNLSMTESEMLRIQQELRKLTRAITDLRELQASKEIKIAESEIAAALDREPSVLDLKAEIRVIDQKITQTLKRSARGEKDRAIINYRRDVKLLNKKVREATEELRPGLLEKMRERARLQVDRDLTDKEAKAASLTKSLTELTTEVDSLRKKVSDMSKNGGKLEGSREDISQVEDMYKRLKFEHEALTVELQAPSQVMILEEATVLKADAQTRRLMLTAGGGVGAFLFVMLGVSWLEYRARRVDRVDEVVHGLGMRLVGELPKVKQAARKAVQPSRKEVIDQQVLTDSVDAARTMLLHLAQTQTLRLVMVTSAVAGEAKTSLSCRLATSLARAGLRTLLIDGDVRKPSAHKVFGGSFEPGLADVLCGKADVQASIRATPVPGVSLLAAGRWSPQLQAALTQGQAGALFAQLRQEYDFVIIDAPPVLPVADALLLGREVDGVLLSVLCRVTQLNALYAASRRIEQLNIPTLGVVVSGVEGRLYGASYPYPTPQGAPARA